MGLFNGLWLVLLGVLGAANLIVARKPEAQRVLHQLGPYQGIIGVVSAVWGVFVLVGAALHLGRYLLHPIALATRVADGALLLGLGLVFGVGLFNSVVGDEDVRAKLERARRELVPYQGTLGVLAIALGAWSVLANVVFGLL